MSVYAATNESTDRHYEPTCQALLDELQALHPEATDRDALLALGAMSKVNNTKPLRARTKRCRAGCWKEYELGERQIAAGQEPQVPMPKPKDDAFHAASVVNDAGARQKAAAKKLAAKNGRELEAIALAAIARQANHRS